MKSPFCPAEFPGGTFNLQSHSPTIQRLSHYRQTFYHTSQTPPNALPRVRLSRVTIAQKFPLSSPGLEYIQCHTMSKLPSDFHEWLLIHMVLVLVLLK